MAGEPPCNSPKRDVDTTGEAGACTSIAVTLDTYSHVLPVADEEAAHTLARVILGE